MRAIVHIGNHKTGTTSIQRFLSANRALLCSQGVLYPARLHHQPAGPDLPDHNQLAFHLAYATPGDFLTPLRRELEGAPCHTLLLSAEVLASHLSSPPLVERLRQFLYQLGCDEVRIVVWLRESGAMFASLCTQSLHDGNPDYAERLPPAACPRLHPVMDYRALLQRFGQVFGRQALSVRLFERECWPQGELLRDAAAAFELAWDERFVLPASSNERLSLLEMGVLRAANHLTAGQCWASATPRGILFAALHRHLGALQDPQLRFVPPQAVTAAWRAWAAEGNEWVRQEFFPERTALFAPPPQEEEHYELAEMKPQWWEALGRTLAELSGEVAALRRELRRVQTGGGAPRH